MGIFQPAKFLDEQKVCLCQLSRSMGDLLSAFLAETYSVSWRAELFDHVSSACFAEQVSANFWSVAGTTLLISQQSVLQSVSLCLQATGFLRGHLLWQESSPGLPGPQANCFIPHIWIHCTPWESKLGQPDRKNCSWSAVRTTQKPVVMFFSLCGTALLRHIPSAQSHHILSQWKISSFNVMALAHFAGRKEVGFK